MKRLYFIILFLLTLLTAAYIIIKRKLAQLSLSVVDIKFKKVSIKELSGTLYLLITNPFGNIELSNLRLDMYIDGYYVGALTQGKSVTEILPNGNLMAKVDFNVSPKKVVSIEHLLMSLSNYGKNNYTLKGTLTLKKWFITANIPINYTSTFKDE